MISKIQGSTQMAGQIQQQETTAAETNKNKNDMNNGPMTTLNDQQRTAPLVQTHNPAAEMKYEAHRMAADLNAQLNTINGGKPESEPKAVVGNYEWMISGLKR